MRTTDKDLYIRIIISNHKIELKGSCVLVIRIFTNVKTYIYKQLRKIHFLILKEWVAALQNNIPKLMVFHIQYVLWKDYSNN